LPHRPVLPLPKAPRFTLPCRRLLQPAKMRAMSIFILLTTAVATATILRGGEEVGGNRILDAADVSEAEARAELALRDSASAPRKNGQRLLRAAATPPDGFPGGACLDAPVMCPGVKTADGKLGRQICVTSNVGGVTKKWCYPPAAKEPAAKEEPECAAFNQPTDVECDKVTLKDGETPCAAVRRCAPPGAAAHPSALWH
jgi:hypothetical protein